MDATGGQAEGLLQALNVLGFGGLVLDHRGQVLQTNEKAQRYLGLNLNVRRHSRDQESEPVHRQQVQSALREALRNASAESPQLGYIVAVPRATRRPLLLRTVQVPCQTPGSIAAVVLLDLEDCPLPNAELLCQIFDLTPAESRLARQLSCGEDLSSIANRFDVSIATLRFQLKSIFWKTGTRRQAELVALLGHIARLSPP